MPGFQGANAVALEAGTTAVAEQGMGYADHPFVFGGSVRRKVWDPFTIIPHWNDRGSPDRDAISNQLTASSPGQ